MDARSHIVGVKKVQEVYAISAFGILILALRQRTLSQEWLESEAGKRLSSAVNAVCLESAQSQACRGSRLLEDERERMERHIMFLQQKICDQKALLKIFEAST